MTIDQLGDQFGDYRYKSSCNPKPDAFENSAL